MTTIDNQTYFVARDKEGAEYLCPLKSVKNQNAVTDRELDNCVERDIVERYSGNITIKPS